MTQPLAPKEVSSLHKGVIEVFVNEIFPDEESAFQQWIAKINHAEAQFPGFQKTSVQPPRQKGGRNWITVLQFDTIENLEHWLESKERAQILQEGAPLIQSIEQHRVITPFGGWFPPLEHAKKATSVWKQSMVILLVLFPLVMLQVKFFLPLMQGVHRSLATFIANALTVAVIAWPMMPIAIWCLGWWLSPEGENYRRTTFIGTGVVLFLYAIEIALFWSF